MTSPPRLHPQYRAVIVEGRGALLLSDRGDRALSGRLFERLIPLIDGAASPADLAMRLEPEHSPAEVFYTLSLLEAQGFLTSGTVGSAAAPPMRLPERAPAVGQQAVAMAVAVVGALPAAECLDALRRQGLRCVETAPFTLVLTDSYLRPELAAVDTAVRASGGTWLPARLSREGIWIGPVFRHGSGPCWQCLSDRLGRNRPLEYHLLRHPENAHPLGSTWPDGDALETAMTIVREACAAALERPSGVEFADAILAIELASGIRRRHSTPRRPQCPGCGDGAAYTRAAEAPMVLVSRLKGVSPGSDRETAPEVTLARFDALVDPLTGVVQHVEQVGAEGDGVHVSAARFGANPTWENGSLLDRGLRQSAGKGITEAQARVSSLGEAIERYSWAYQGDEPRRVASFEELGANAIHPNACMLVSDAQYAARGAPAQAAPASRWHVVPPPLDPRARIEWTPVWSLSAERRRYLPTGLLYGGYPAAPEVAYCIADPTGNAAGNSREEAVLQGLLELVERDALSIWWYNRVRRPAVALDAIDDPSVRRLARWHETRGRTLWALDLTTDLGIPAFAAVSHRVAGKPDAILFGFGAHLDPATALTRALLELGQIDVQVTRAEQEGRALDPTLAAWLSEATVGNQPYLEPAPGAATALAELPRLATDDLREDIGLCQRALARAGIELLLLDQTRPDVGVPVVKVLAPGLRHFRPRFALGRLYDVPVRLGWLAGPRAEGELNPIPFFL